jgi:hypothetical protein
MRKAGEAFVILLYAASTAASEGLVPAGPGEISVAQLHAFCSSPNGSRPRARRILWVWYMAYR